MPDRDAPLSLEEIQAAADIFFPLFNEVSTRMPKNASTEDTLKVMENVAKLAQRERMKAREKEAKLKFGFNKDGTVDIEVDDKKQTDKDD